jgi:hypothetical protein
MSSNNNSALTFTPLTMDLVASFGYETTAYGVIAVGYGSPHIIWYGGNPNGLFTQVPNGSFVIDSVNHHTYTKTGALGSGSSGAWIVNS